MIHMNYESREGRRVSYSVAFTFGRVLNDLQGMNIDEEYMAPLLDKIMETGGDRGIFGTDRGGR